MPKAKCQSRMRKGKCRMPKAEGQRPNVECQMLNVHGGTWVRRAGSAYFSGQFRESPANLRGTRRAICMTMEKPYDIRERSFLFSCEVVDFCRPLIGREQIVRDLGRQLLRSATSVGANLEEADAGQSKPDFRSKVAISRKECCEARYWLRLLNHANPPLLKVSAPLIAESSELVAILTTIKKNSEANDDRGEPTSGQVDRNG